MLSSLFSVVVSVIVILAWPCFSSGRLCRSIIYWPASKWNGRRWEIVWFSCCSRVSCRWISLSTPSWIDASTSGEPTPAPRATSTLRATNTWTCEQLVSTGYDERRAKHRNKMTCSQCLLYYRNIMCPMNCALPFWNAVAHCYCHVFSCSGLVPTDVTEFMG